MLVSLCTLTIAYGQSYTPLYDSNTFNRGIGQDPSRPVGTTAGQGAVSLTGGATYSIPIAVPPGTNGVAPSVSLEYNSMGGNGLLGMGWNLSGVSMISRVPQTIYQDGKAGSIELNANDRFALDGQRLIAASEVYGANNTTYTTESETFSKITSYDIGGINGPGWFKVELKDGTIMEYGSDYNSSFRSASSANVYWLLKKVTYRDGNYIEYVYYDNEADRRLKEINYTGNSNAGLAPYNKILFEYTLRTDKNVAYQAGVYLYQNHLLSTVTVSAEGQTVRRYQLNYGFDDINSYLKEVVESGSDGSSLNSTIFKYGDKPADMTEESAWLTLENSKQISSGDFDGDGYTDILTNDLAYSGNFEYSTSFSIYKRTAGYSVIGHAYTQTLPTAFQVVRKKNVPDHAKFLSNDFTGDGMDDVVIANVSPNSTNSSFSSLTIYKSGSNGTSYTAINVPIYYNFTKIHPSGKFIFPGDFNGDGTQDLLTMAAHVNGGSYASHLCFGGSGSLSFGTIGLTGSYSLGMDQWPAADQVYVLDFNGDGRSDLMIIKESQCEIFTFDEYSGYNGRRIYASNFPTKNHLIYLGDFNGDGKTDLLTRSSLTDNMAGWTTAISTGTDFYRPGFEFSRRPQITDNHRDDQLSIADFNGDGKTDICLGYNYYSSDGTYLNLSGYYMYYSRGSSFHQVHHTSNYYHSNNLGGLVTFDGNGDGRVDVINRVHSQTALKYVFFKKEGKEHLLEKVLNGFNHLTEWNYKRLTEAVSFYSRDLQNSDPFINIQIPLYAVSELKAYNGIGGWSTLQYSYEGAKLHKQGKGFMGFRGVYSTDLTMGTKTYTEMQFVSTPVVAAAVKRTNTSRGYVTLNETTYENEFTAYGSGATKRYWQWVRKITEHSPFEGRTTTSDFIYDGHGNVTTSTVNNGIESTVTNTLYEAHGTPIPAKPTQVTVDRTRNGQSTYSVITRYGYNHLGQLTSKTDFWGRSKSVTTSYLYNSFGNLRETTVSPAGLSSRTTSYEYNPSSKGRYATSTTNPLGQTSSAEYDARWGTPTRETGVDGLTTTYEYDAFGRLKNTNLKVGTGDAYSVSNYYGWDFNHGAIYTTYVDHPGKPNVKTWYDVLGRQVRTETEGFQGQTIIQSQTYDARGNVATATQPYKSGESVLTTTTQYDEYNRPTRVGNDQFGFTTTSYSYSNGELKVTTTNPVGQQTSKEIDASGQVIRATDNGGTLHYTYNSQGNLRTVTKDGVTLSTSEYDDYGHQTKLIDPNAGTTSYDYNALGQLTNQTNAAGQVTTLNYDNVGRITTRQGPEGNTTSEYYPSGSGAAVANRLQKITTIFGTNTSTEEYEYDNYGRIQRVKETVDGTDHQFTYGYNRYDDQTSKSFPSGFTVRHEYDGNGYLNYIRNGENNVTLYTNNGVSGLGVNTNYSLGNGKSSTINHHYGMPTQYLTDGVQNLVMNWNYQSGNLMQRKDDRPGYNRQEDFEYDVLNRLKKATVAGQNAQEVNYGNLGNIDFKTDVGNYAYNSGRPNALTSVTNPNSVVPNLGQTIVYTPFSQPQTVSENGYELSYIYGSDYNRIRSITKQNGNEINRRYYFGDYEKDQSGGSTRHLHYISSPAGLIAIVVRENGSDNYYYTYTDHLGSILTVTNSSGAVVAEQSFDAWGRRRAPNTWVPYTSATQSVNLPVWLYRGYTGHEQLDQFGLINMNGRLYDPALGRVLSPDNYVQDPFSSQNYNRYSYVLNNPLKYTDPDGEIIVPLIIAGLLLTDVGYDIQKAISPIAVHIDLDFGTHGNGIGLDASIGAPQVLPVNYRYDIGASYYFSRVGGYGSGWQMRNGAEWGIGIGLFQIQHEGMRYRDWNSDGLQADQVVHTTQIGMPFANASYSNDTEGSFPWAKYVPLIPKLREGSIPETDRYRTASGRLRFGLFETGFFLHTGEGDQVRRVDTNGDGIGDTRAVVGGNIGESRRSNGITYLGFGGFRIGWDSEGIRHGLQNRLAHDGMSRQPQFGVRYPWMLRLDRSPRFVFQFGGF